MGLEDSTHPTIRCRYIEEELSDLGLLDVVELLPADWRERGDLLDIE